MSWSFAEQAPNRLVGLVGEGAPRLPLVFRWSSKNRHKSRVRIVNCGDQFGAKRADKLVPDRVRYGSPAPRFHLRNEGGELRILRPGPQGLKHEALPALQAEPAVVELDRKQIPLRKTLSGEEAVPDLAGAGAMVISPEAELIESVAPDYPGVGGPDALVFRIVDNRHLCRIQIPAPAFRAVSPGGGQPAIMPKAPGQSARDGPTDAPLCVACNQILVRDPHPMRDVQRLAHVPRPLQRKRAPQVHGGRIVGDPAICELA